MNKSEQYFFSSMGMENLEPWQQRALDQMANYTGKGTIQVTGRQTGKSHYAAYARLFDDIFNADIKVKDLLLNEGTVYGSRYYTVEPVGGSFFEMEKWCLDTFGGSGDSIWGSTIPEPACRWYANNRKFWFRDERDLMVFVLKWR